VIVYPIYILIIIVAVGLNIIGKRVLKERWSLAWGYGIPALIMVIFLLTVSQPSTLFNDFNKAYYPAGQLIFKDPASLYKEECHTGFVNLPIIALLCLPFSILNLGTAQTLVSILSILCLGAVFYILIRYRNASKEEMLLIGGLFAINGPLAYSLREGNSTHFVLLLLVVALICLGTNREVWSGILLAISALIKLPLFIFGVYFLLRGRWRGLLGMSVATVAIVGASLLLFGIDLHQVWLQQCVQPNAGNPVAAYNVQSLDGFLARLLTDGNLFNWQPLVMGWQFKVIRYLLLSLLVGGAIWICWRSKPPITPEEQNVEFSIVLCMAVIISPISWTHYYLFLLLPLSLYLGKRLAVPRERFWFNLIMLSVLLISLPVKRFKLDDPTLIFLISKILISHYFYGGLLLMGVLLAARSHRVQPSQLPSNLQNSD
jgi:hypothetical protein